MTGPYDHLEDDLRVRPRRGGSRRRTKERPAHEDAVPATVRTVDRGRYTCELDGVDGADLGTRAGPGGGGPVLVAMKARELGRKGVVVGDRVELVGDVSGDSGSLARVVRVAPRTTVLRRSADDDDASERVLVANADQLVVVTALADPPPRRRLVDRCLVAAYDGGLHPVLCLTKADLADPRAMEEAYVPLGVDVVVTARARDLDPLRARLRGRTSVLVGHSGVGKSTLVNALVPAAERQTGVVNAVTGRGRHTSSSAVSFALPGGGHVVDTPGVRSFGLAHVRPARLVAAFPDLAAVTGECPRRCTHATDAPDCALDTAVAEGRLDPARVVSFRGLLASLSGRDETGRDDDATG